MTVAQRLWKSLMARHRKKDKHGVLLYREPKVTREEFYEWVEGQRWGKTFRCRYFHGPLSDSEASIDHVTPLSKGGRTELSNMVICGEKANRIKADTHGGSMDGLAAALKQMRPDDRASFEARLCAAPAWKKKGA